MFVSEKSRISMYKNQMMTAIGQELLPENPTPMTMLVPGTVSITGFSSGVMVYMQLSSTATRGSTPGNLARMKRVRKARR